MNVMLGHENKEISMKGIVLIVCLGLFLFVLTPFAFSAGPGFSGITAIADSAETVITNPAGMTRLDQSSIYLNPLVIYTNSESEITAENTGRTVTISGDNWLAMPGLYYVRPLGDRWAVGVGPSATLGLGASYGDEWPGRYLLDKWSLTFIGIAPALAYRVNDQVSLGMSVIINYSLFRLEKAVYNLDPAASDGSFELEADGWGMGANLGILYELSPHTRFGIVYRSEVSATVEGKPRFSGLTDQRLALLNQSGALNKKISFDTTTPQAVTAGLFHDFQNRWSFSLDVMWLDFSNWGLKNVQIGDTEISTRSTEYKDIWATSLGVNYELTQQWTIRGGTFYVSSAIDDEDRTIFLRLDEMWGVGLGIKYDFDKMRSVALDVTYIQFGDGEFTAENVPVAGDIKGEFTTSYALVYSISITW